MYNDALASEPYDLTLFDNELIPFRIVDIYQSFIWTTRYSAWGDYEIHSPISTRAWNDFAPDNYIGFDESSHFMIIEDRLIQTDIDLGNVIISRGRSLESLLERRVIWKQTIIDGDLQTGIEKLLNENAINPIDPDRKIPRLVFEASTDPRITTLSIQAQFTGDVLYDAIKSLCDVFSIGFKIEVNDQGEFVFRLWSGADRSYDQEINPYVIFSPEFDNLLNSNYLESKKLFKNVALIAGEGEGSERKTQTVGTAVGLERRELFVDARDISSKATNDQGESIEIPIEEYDEQLKQRGEDKLAETRIETAFDAQVDAYSGFKYNKDFFLGDVVQIENEYGVSAQARITEVVRSNDRTGRSMVPTFTII